MTKFMVFEKVISDHFGFLCFNNQSVDLCGLEHLFVFLFV